MVKDNGVTLKTVPLRSGPVSGVQVDGSTASASKRNSRLLA